MPILLAEVDHGQQILLSDALTLLFLAEPPDAIGDDSHFSIEILLQHGSNAHIRSAGVWDEGSLWVRVHQNGGHRRFLTRVLNAHSSMSVHLKAAFFSISFTRCLARVEKSGTNCH